MKRLLCILSGMNAGGAETFLMKIYRNLDRTEYQMDFCINVPEKCYYEDEILSLGGRVYRIPAKSVSLRGFKKQLYEVIKANGYYHVLRITSSGAGFMDLKIAQRAGAGIRAARSSNSSDGGSLKSEILHRLGRILYGRYVNVRIAPSDLAARYTFGRRMYEKGFVNVLHNGIDISERGYDAEGRRKIRSELHISDDVRVIGHVGRFMTQKNHGFLLEIFSRYVKENENSMLLLVGGGELETQIRKQAETLGILDRIVFAGVRSDVPALLSAMDVFVFPSLYEGMPNAVIEAQATGLPCIISDTVTREADITGLVSYLPLGDAAAWADCIAQLPVTLRTTPKKQFVANGYDIDSVTEQFIGSIFGE